MSGYDLHPEAFEDIDELAAYIGQESPEAAHRVVDEIYAAFAAWFLFRTKDTVASTSRAAPCASSSSGNT